MTTVKPHLVVHFLLTFGQSAYKLVWPQSCLPIRVLPRYDISSLIAISLSISGCLYVPPFGRKVLTGAFRYSTGLG